MSFTADQIQQMVQRALAEFESIIVSQDPPTQVLSRLVEVIAKTTGTRAATLWLAREGEGGRFTPVVADGREARLAVDEANEPIEPVRNAIGNATGQKKTVVIGPGQEGFAGTPLHESTQFFMPLETTGKANGALHLIYPADLDPKIYRQYIAFAQQGTRAASLYLTRRQQQVIQEDAAGTAAVLRSIQTLIAEDEPFEVIHELANAARPVLSAQRVSVIGFWGKKPHLAFSDVVDVNRRGVLSRAVEQLAEAVRQRDVPMTFLKGQEYEDDDVALAQNLDEIYALGGAEAICLTPIRAEEQVLGVLICEYASQELVTRFAPLQQEISRYVGPILARTIEWTSRPLRRTSRALAKVRARPRSFLMRLTTTLTIIGAVVWIVGFMPFALYVRGDARLESASKALVTASRAGRIESIPVNTGDVVAKGDVVVLMDDAQLQLQLASVNKQIAANQVQADSALTDADPVKREEALLAIEHLVIERERLQRQLADTRIPSPIDGAVMNEKPAQFEGRTVKKGDAIVQIGDLSSFELVVELREGDVALLEEALRAGREVNVEFLSRPWPDLVQRAAITDLSAISPTSRPDEEGVQHVFRVRVPVELTGMSPQLVLANPTGRAKLHVGEASLLYRYGRRVWHFIQMTLLF